MTESSVRRLRFRHLQLMKALATTNSLRKAGSLLKISQPAASKLLRELEEVIQEQLFVRTRKGVTPNRYGVALIRHAQSILAESESALEEIRSIKSGAYDQIRIGIFAMAAAPLLASGITLLRKETPALSVHVEDGTAPAMTSALMRRELDCILGRLEETRIGERVPVLPARVALVVRKGHPLLKRKKVRLSDVAGEEWILPARGALMRGPTEALFTLNGLTLPRSRVESSSLLMNEVLLQRSDAVCPFPELLATRLTRSGLLQMLPISISIPVPVLALWINHGPPYEPKVERIIRALKAVSVHHLDYVFQIYRLANSWKLPPREDQPGP